jgi:hypothetical protein
LPADDLGSGWVRNSMHLGTLNPAICSRQLGERGVDDPHLDAHSRLTARTDERGVEDAFLVRQQRGDGSGFR